MGDTIKGSIIGAIITGIVSFAIFFLGNFSTQSTLEKKTVETLSQYFDSVDNDMTYKQALQVVYEQYKIAKNEIEVLKSQKDEQKMQMDDIPSQTTSSSTLEGRGNINSPELLGNLTPVSGAIEKTWDASKKDNYGNKYSSGICLHQDYNKAAHVVYSLDNKYSVLTGKFVLDEESKNTDGHYVLYAYSLIDGNKSLIYESQVLSTATRPINVDINVKNVMDLVIEVYDPNKGGDNANTGLVDAKLE